jgi:hypothetical protein
MQPGESFIRLTERLSEASVQRRWEAYRAIDWSDPALTIDREDPRWQLSSWDPLGASEWYRDQPAEARSELGLHRVAALLKAGIEFEAALGRGLLRYAATLPNNHPAFRYVYHEITEEAQHSMMFQEVVNRSGLDVPPPPDRVREMCETFARTVEHSSAQFLLMALSGEEALDHIQRQAIADPSMHPLLRRIYVIHVAEESRHLSFARGYLQDTVPRLPERDRRLLRLRAPFIVDWTARHVFGVEAFMTARGAKWALPPEVMAGIADGPAADAIRRRSAARTVRVCQTLGLVDRRLESVWSGLGVS